MLDMNDGHNVNPLTASAMIMQVLPGNENVMNEEAISVVSFAAVVSLVSEWTRRIPSVGPGPRDAGHVSRTRDVCKQVGAFGVSDDNIVLLCSTLGSGV